MKLLGLDITWARKDTGISIDTLIKRLDSVYETYSGVAVTPENCERAPTVKAVLTAITRRFAVMPVHVYRKSTSSGRESKELLPNHPVERLLAQPNEWQTRSNFWMDAVSRLARYGNFYAFKARGSTGPIRRLEPQAPGQVEVKQEDNLDITYRVNLATGGVANYDLSEMFHARLAARDGIKGDSPVTDIRDSIGLEIAIEQFGASFFGSGGMPGIVFEYADGSQGFKDDIERQEFLNEFQERYAKRGRFRAIIPPKGIKMGQPISVENEKAQFLQTRQYQRTVIAGAWGVPQHLVGDLSKGTFNNVEQQGIDFSSNVIVPLVTVFESAMERDLLTVEDRRGGVIIRFNPDAVLRSDFKTRQDGLAVQRQNGVISANEWREREGMNPRTDPGGDEYFVTGPSGQTPTNATAADNADIQNADSAS